MTRDPLAPARGITFAVAAGLLVWGLILAATSEHLSTGHLAAVVMVAVGGSALVRLVRVRGWVR